MYESALLGFWFWGGCSRGWPSNSSFYRWCLCHLYSFEVFDSLWELSFSILFDISLQSIGQYWPSSPSDILVIDKFSVSEVSREVTDDYIIRDLTLKSMKEDDDPESEPEVGIVEGYHLLCLLGKHYNMLHSKRVFTDCIFNVLFTVRCTLDKIPGTVFSAWSSLVSFLIFFPCLVPWLLRPSCIPWM